MRYLFLFVFIFFLSLTGIAQALRDINYRYLYNPEENFRFTMKTVRGDQTHTTYFKLELRDSTSSPGDYTITWQLRGSISDKEGNAVSAESVHVGDHAITGKVSYPVSEPVIIYAKVINATRNGSWSFYQSQEKKFPVNDALIEGDDVVHESYVNLNQVVKIPSDGGPRIVSYYAQIFPAAVPPFAESQGKVSRALVTDSMFVVQPGQTITFSKSGLYLMQRDTSAAEGLAFRVEDDYPRFAKVESLADPLVYICTKEEFSKVKQAKGDKKAFDRVILSIAGDKDRARILFRSYFRRVELANEFFSTYKEGWKTDRGMIYIIFGPPNAVYKFADREVWNYNTDDFERDFSFAKSATLFDPENYVLVREKGVRDTWYEMIDLWRSARF